MNKKISLLIVGIILLNINLAISKQVFADDTHPLSKTDTNAHVQFIPRNDPTKPVDPEDPSKPVDPANPTDPADPDNPGTGNNGPLSLDFISNIHFGEQAISGKEQTYNAINKNPYIQVTDNRGTGAGWALTAQISEFTGKNAKTNQTEILKGTVLSIKNAVLRTESTNTSKEPTSKNIVFNNNDAQLVINAAENTGQGTWVNVYEKPEDITLTVPGSVAKSNVAYKAKVNWVLSDTPK